MKNLINYTVNTAVEAQVGTPVNDDDNTVLSGIKMTGKSLLELRQLYITQRILKNHEIRFVTIKDSALIFMSAIEISIVNTKLLNVNLSKLRALELSITATQLSNCSFLNSKFEQCYFMANPQAYLGVEAADVTYTHCKFDMSTFDRVSFNSSIDCWHSGLSFKNCEFELMEFNYMNIADGDFSGTTGSDVRFTAGTTHTLTTIPAVLNACNFSGCDFTLLIMTDQEVRFGLWKDSVFQRARISGVHFFDVDFSNTDFSGAQFRNCIFTKCNFTNTNIRSAMFIDCTFKESSFDKAINVGTAAITATARHFIGG